MLSKRDRLDTDQVREMSSLSAELLVSLPVWIGASAVALYWPLGKEMDTRPLLENLWSRTIVTALPRCRQGEQGVMDFCIINGEKDLGPGAFGIMEPCLECDPVPDFSPDIIVVPGVAYDRRGMRLGFGGGFYDRFLCSPALNKTLKIGLCYSFQVVEELPADPWDQPMDAVCTEEFIWFK